MRIYIYRLLITVPHTVSETTSVSRNDITECVVSGDIYRNGFMGESDFTLFISMFGIQGETRNELIERYSLGRKAAIHKPHNLVEGSKSWTVMCSAMLWFMEKVEERLRMIKIAMGSH